MNKIWLFGDYSQAEIRVAAWAGPISSMKEWFRNNEDIHLNVARLIGKTVEENKLSMPRQLWMRKPYMELNNEDPEDHDNERDAAKRTVHANTNGMGAQMFAQITSLPLRYARMLQDIYHSLFPEIHKNYHAGIRECLRKTRIVENPLGWKRRFYGIYDFITPEVEREAFAWFPQSTIGLLMKKTIHLWCEAFKNEKHARVIQTPRVIRSMGFDTQLEVHDSGGIVCSNDSLCVREIACEAKRLAERTMLVRGFATNTTEELLVPMDFKTGPSWGELKTYYLD